MTTLNPSVAEQELLTLAEAEQSLLKTTTARANLLHQQGELKSQVDRALAGGDVDSSKTVVQLSQDRTRLEMFPAKIAELDRSIEQLMEKLLSACCDFTPIFLREAGRERAAASERIKAALLDVGLPDLEADGLVGEILSHSDTLHAADCRGNFCAPVALLHCKTPQALLAVATHIRKMFDLYIAKL